MSTGAINTDSEVARIRCEMAAGRVRQARLMAAGVVGGWAVTVAACAWLLLRPEPTPEPEPIYWHEPSPAFDYKPVLIASKDIPLQMSAGTAPPECDENAAGGWFYQDVRGDSLGGRMLMCDGHEWRDMLGIKNFNVCKDYSPSATSTNARCPTQEPTP